MQDSQDPSQISAAPTGEASVPPVGLVSSVSVNPAQVLLPLGLGTALSLMGDATLYTVLPTHTAEVGITLVSVGLILSINRAIRLLVNNLAGSAYDRWPRRRMFIPALFLGAVSTAIYALAQGLGPLLVGRLLWGLAWSGIWVGGTTTILDVTNRQDRGRWTGLYQTWFFIGAATGSFAGGALTDWLGYTGAMWVGASITAAGAFFAWARLPETRPARRQAAPKPGQEGRARWFRNPGLWIAITIQGLNRFITAGVLAATMALLVQDHLAEIGIPLGLATLTGGLMAGRTLLSLVSAPLAGVFSDKLGSRWWVLLASLAIGALGMLLIGDSQPLTILTGILLGAVAGGSIQALVTTISGDQVAIANRGRAIGILHTSGDLGSTLGPLAAYALLPFIGLPGVYQLCALLFAVGLLFLLGLYVTGFRLPGHLD